MFSFLTHPTYSCSGVRVGVDYREKYISFISLLFTTSWTRRSLMILDQDQSSNPPHLLPSFILFLTSAIICSSFNYFALTILLLSFTITSEEVSPSLSPLKLCFLLSYWACPISLGPAAPLGGREDEDLGDFCLD